LTVIKVPQGIDSNKIVKHAFSRYNLSIGIGLSQVSSAAVRAE
jgi:alanine-glyoxylate transaminase/serine-glyoxylate transaminase/serine-pyruvate transaminase